MANETAPETLPMDWTKYNKAGECGCVICGKPIPSRSTNDKGIYVHIGQGGDSILRVDLPTVENEITVNGKKMRGEDLYVLSTGPDTGDMGWFQVGPNCAKKLGKAFYKVLDEVADFRQFTAEEIKDLESKK